MLAITRKPHEKVKIGDDILVTVHAVIGGAHPHVDMSIDMADDIRMVTAIPGQQMHCGSDVVVKVYQVRSDGRVRLAIDAPRHVPIRRLDAKLQRSTPAPHGQSA